MRRREAVQILKEIGDCLADCFISSALLIPNDQFKDEFELRIRTYTQIEDYTNLKHIVKKHGLNLKKEKDVLLIYATETKPKEIELLA